ncbi:MAG: substrate-binding domain-containing protein [Coraliomargarita sp.]
MIKRRHIMLLLEWYDYRIHRGVARVAREHGWQLNCPKDPVTNEGILKDWKGDGCIALLQCTETLEYFRSHAIPLVDLGLGDHTLPVPRVVTDNQEIGRLAAEHFRDQGYRELFTLHPDGIKMYEERLQAITHYMEADGGKVTILRSSRMQNSVIDELREIAAKRNRKLQELSIGFFAFQDTMAAEMISLALQNELRVPENVAVLGIDNDDLINSGLTIELSSVDSDQEGLGIEAATILKNLLSNPSLYHSQHLVRHAPKGVIIRQSTDCYAVENPLVANALHWIKNHFYTGIQATDVAHAMGVSQQGLQKAFSNGYTKSPGQEIRHQRTMAVAHLLRSSNATLDEIAKNCGYYSVNSLINGFRAEYHTTPGKYRKQHKETVIG